MHGKRERRELKESKRRGDKRTKTLNARLIIIIVVSFYLRSVKTICFGT